MPTGTQNPSTLVLVRRRPPSTPAPYTAADLLDAFGVTFLVSESGVVVESAPSVSALGLVRGSELTEPAVASLIERVRSLRRADSAVVTLSGEREFVVHARPVGTSSFILASIEEADEARRIEAIRRDFVANVSHELKTPIGGLSLLAEAITDASEDPDEVVKFAERMRTEVTRLSQLVTDLLALSQLQSADPLYEAELVSIDHIVDAAMDRCRLRASYKAIAIVPGGTQGIGVFGNEEQLTVALSNLLINAITYSPERTQVGVGVRVVDDVVEIVVTDQGTGIPPAEQERIFERFYRVDPARSRASGGTGLGLAIVKHIVVNHGGSVSVWSEEDEGSTFTIRLPKAMNA
jgi:two-component system, OmpR family, sensor histidine kinase SenX3